MTLILSILNPSGIFFSVLNLNPTSFSASSIVFTCLILEASSFNILLSNPASYEATDISSFFSELFSEVSTSLLFAVSLLLSCFSIFSFKDSFASLISFSGISIILFFESEFLIKGELDLSLFFISSFLTFEGELLSFFIVSFLVFLFKSLLSAFVFSVLLFKSSLCFISIFLVFLLFSRPNIFKKNPLKFMHINILRQATSVPMDLLYNIFLLFLLITNCLSELIVLCNILFFTSSLMKTESICSLYFLLKIIFLL
ncbi:hypothetical protein CNEONATNEC32_02094 [Clostridium neonatale]|nr:hypothetical protein CNEONATNEC32_02094 [Clostridium neonatale]